MTLSDEENAVFAFDDLNYDRYMSATWSRGKKLDDVIETLWQAAQDHAMTDGKTYEAIRGAIEYLACVSGARLESL